MSNSDGTGSNGHDPAALEAEHRIRAAMEDAYGFPGFYPVVVIARQGPDFEADLQATLAAEQGGSPYRIRERTSRKGNYVSYRVELYVETAQAALDRKAILAELPGVLLLL
jgi:putative lipoic acid-binding regulatory protein